MNQMKKEELEITISDSDRIECAIRHIQTAVDVDLWARKIAVEAMEKEISALQEQDSPKPKAESVQNVQNEDLISRKAAIDALMEIMDRPNHADFLYTDEICKTLNDLPSVQPEPCEDAVNRDSVKFLLCKETCHPGAFCPDGFCREICEKVDALPSATPKQRMGEWIPVSERLPEPRVDVWVNSDIGQIQGYYEEHIGIWYASFGQGRDYLELIVTAWMPLPEPYRAERRTDE